jgi:hypothetical protein
VNIILGLYPREIFEKIFNSPSAQFTDTQYLDWWWTYTALKFSDIRLSKNSIYLKALHMTDNQQLFAPRSSIKQKTYIILLQPFELVKDLFVEQRFRFNIFIDRIFFLIISYYFLSNLIKSITEFICNIFLKLKKNFSLNLK